MEKNESFILEYEMRLHELALLKEVAEKILSETDVTSFLLWCNPLIQAYKTKLEELQNA